MVIEPLVATTTPAHSYDSRIAQMPWEYREPWLIPQSRSFDETFPFELAMNPAIVPPTGRPAVSLSYYNFKDSNNLDQQGVFLAARTGLLANGKLEVDAHANERHFRQAPDSADRLEVGLDLKYRLNERLAFRAGVSDFETQDHGGRLGFSAGVAWRLCDAAILDVFYRHRDPVDDSFATVADAMTQNSAGVLLDVRLNRRWSVYASGTDSFYYDGNNRRDIKAGLAWLLIENFSAYARLEYELLDYSSPKTAYPTPHDFHILRPVLELSPRLCRCLAIDLRGELPYIIRHGRLGTGLSVGPRLSLFQNRLEASAVYLNYHVPGEATNWSGQGFKVELAYRF